MKDEYEKFKKGLDMWPSPEDKLDILYRWVKGDWISFETFKKLVADIYEQAWGARMESL
jgi:hypothetical protein